ncbi:unnamed protein product [Caenorhabditis brenneri]
MNRETNTAPVDLTLHNTRVIETELKLEGLSSIRKGKIGNHVYTFVKSVEKEYLVDDSFELLAYVKIKKATRIQKKRLRDISSHPIHTDGVLIVEGEKFHISKGLLAKVSPYFRQLFYGNHLDANKEENELRGVTSKDFQIFLEETGGTPDANNEENELHGGNSREFQETVIGILRLARQLDLESCINKRAKFLVEESEKTYKEKLAIAAEYQLNYCIMRLDSKEAISVAMPNDVRDMDPITAKLLLQKSLCFK